MARKKKQKADKRYAYGITIPKSSHSRIRALKKDHEPEIHGDKFWNSSYLIMDFLEKQGLPPNPSVMEIGCGWGAAGIYCAKQHQASVVGVDADPNVFPYLHLSAEMNDVSIRTRGSRFENLKKKHLAPHDLVIGADICFWDELIDPLYAVIRKAVKAGVGQIIIADPGRPPFDEVCARCQKKFDAQVKEWEIDNNDVKAHGWLLVVGSLSAA
jgi:predicted nicotinamide N-methyase